MSNKSGNASFMDKLPSMLTVYSSMLLLPGLIWLSFAGQYDFSVQCVSLAVAACLAFKANEMLIRRHFEMNPVWSARKPYSKMLSVQLWNWFIMYLWNRTVIFAFATRIMYVNPIPMLVLSYAVELLPLCLLLLFDSSGHGREGVYPYSLVIFQQAAYVVSVLFIVVGLNGIIGVKTVFTVIGCLYIFTLLSTDKHPRPGRTE